MVLRVAGRHIDWNIMVGEQLGLVYPILNIIFLNTEIFLTMLSNQGISESLSGRNT